MGKKGKKGNFGKIYRNPENLEKFGKIVQNFEKSGIFRKNRKYQEKNDKNWEKSGKFRKNRENLKIGKIVQNRDIFEKFLKTGTKLIKIGKIVQNWEIFEKIEKDLENQKKNDKN